MEGWIQECRDSGVVPLPTTVVPVTKRRPFSARAYLSNFLRGKNPLNLNNDRTDGILEFNDWVKKYSIETGLMVLDLESAVRCSETDRHLRDDLHSGDGLHLNKKAYDLLDQILLTTLERVDWRSG